MRTTLHELVYAYTRSREDGPALWRALLRELERWCWSYPEHYFPGGARDAAALDVVCNDLFERCELRTYGRPPFGGRTPFRAYTEDQLPSPPIRRHTVYDRWSLAREVLTPHHRRNIRRDPALRRTQQVHRALETILPRVAEPVWEAQARVPAWKAAGQGPALARSEEEVLKLLRQRALPLSAAAALDPEALGVVAREALVLAGVPRHRSAVARQIAALLGSAGEKPVELEEVLDPLELERRISLREVILQGWHQLEPLDRALVRAFAAGEDAETMLARDPRLGNPTALCRAYARVSEKLLAPLQALEGRSSTLPPQRRMIELVRALLELFPEWT